MNEFPPTDDPLVAAVQRLLSRAGGPVAVGDEAGINDQSLYQIAYCKPDSKTGTPKSVGPSIRKRLSAAYPGWLDEQRGVTAAPPSIPHQAPPTLAQALERLGIELARDMPNDVRQDVADTLAKLALRRGAERHQSELLTLLSAAPGKRQAGP